MPRLNGKFVSKAVFEAAMAEQEETTMSEVTANEVAAEFEVDETPVADKRKGQRPGTALKKARLALVKAQSKADDARRKLNAYNADVQALNDAVNAADVVVADAEAEVQAQVDAL